MFTDLFHHSQGFRVDLPVSVQVIHAVGDVLNFP